LQHVLGCGRRKLAIVARPLRGEPLELVTRETNVSIARLTEWRERALADAATALKVRERDDRDDGIECLGIEASPSFVREPEGNGVAERFIRTLKENLGEDLRHHRSAASRRTLVANDGWVAGPVKAVSRRRRGPQASLY
jgi:hypothetical protein